MGGADRCGARRGPRDQPARGVVADRGRDHPGHRPHAVRAPPRRPAYRSHPHDEPRRLQAADDRRRPGDRQRARRRARPAAHESRLEGARRAADHPTAAAIANAIRDATGAEVHELPVTGKRCCARCARPARGGRRRLELRRASELDEVGDGHVDLRAAPRSCRSCAPGLATGERSSTCAASCRVAIDGGAIGAGTTLAELECDPEIPTALREACRLAASPQLRNMGTLAGNLLQSTRCCLLAARVAVPAARRRRVLRARGRAPRARDLRERLLRVGAPVRRRRRAARARRHRADEPARAAARRAVPRCRPTDDRRTTTLEPGELILSRRVPRCDASVYLKAMERKRWAFPLVGVAACARGRRDPRGAGRRRADAVAARRAASTQRRRCPGTRTRSRSRRRSSSGPKPRSRPLDHRLRLTPSRRSRWRSPPAAALAAGRRTPRRRGERRRRRLSLRHASTGRARHGTKPTKSLDPAKTYDVTPAHELRQLHDPARREDLAERPPRRSLARPRRLLRPHGVPSHRPGLHHPGRRPDGAAAPAGPATRPSTRRRQHALHVRTSSRWRRRRPRRPARAAASSSSSPAADAGLPPEYAVLGSVVAGTRGRRPDRQARRPDDRAADRDGRDRDARPSGSSDGRRGRARRGRGDPVRRPEAASAAAGGARGARRDGRVAESSWSKEPALSNHVRTRFAR